MPLNNNTSACIDRRALLIGGAVLCLPLRAAALSTSNASAYVQNVIDDVLNVINSNRSESQMLIRFKQVFTSYADIPIIARSVIGPAWRGLSSTQRTSFSAAFGHYLSYKYGRQFREYRGSTITISRIRDAGNKGILVESQVRQTNQSPFILEWQVSDRSGQTKLINLIIEGISLLGTEREEIRAKLAAHRGNVNALSAELRGG